MKVLYRSIFFLCVVILILLPFVDIAIPSNVWFAHRLLMYPAKWELKFTDSDNSIFRVNPSKGKTQLLSFIEQNRDSFERSEELTVGLLVALIFSLVGWLRERKGESRQIPNQAHGEP